MKPDKIYIIHYSKLKDRYLHISKFFDNCEIPYEFILENDQEDLSSETLDKYYKPNKEEYEKRISKLWNINAHKFRYLNKAEISCTIKHITAIQKLSIECPNYGLILEDDAIFSDDFNEKSIKYFKQTPNDWDSIFLGEGCGINFQNLKLLDSKMVNENVYLMPNPATNCAEAYLLKPSIAGKIANSIIPFQNISDWEIAYQLYLFEAKTYWWYPSLVTQGSKNGKFQSTLDQGQR